MLKYIFSKTKRFMGLTQSSKGIKLTLYIYIYMQGCNAKKVIWSCSCSFFQASQTLKQFGWIFFREPMGTGTEVIQVKQIWFDVSSWKNGRTNLADFLTWIPTLFYKMDSIFNPTSIAAHFSLYIYNK